MILDEFNRPPLRSFVCTFVSGLHCLFYLGLIGVSLWAFPNFGNGPPVFHLPQMVIADRFWRFLMLQSSGIWKSVLAAPYKNVDLEFYFWAEPDVQVRKRDIGGSDKEGDFGV